MAIIVIVVATATLLPSIVLDYSVAAGPYRDYTYDQRRNNSRMLKIVSITEQKLRPRLNQPPGTWP